MQASAIAIETPVAGPPVAASPTAANYAGDTSVFGGLMQGILQRGGSDGAAVAARSSAGLSDGAPHSGTVPGADSADATPSGGTSATPQSAESPQGSSAAAASAPPQSAAAARNAALLLTIGKSSTVLPSAVEELSRALTSAFSGADGSRSGKQADATSAGLVKANVASRKDASSAPSLRTGTSAAVSASPAVGLPVTLPVLAPPASVAAAQEARAFASADPSEAASSALAASATATATPSAEPSLQSQRIAALDGKVSFAAALSATSATASVSATTPATTQQAPALLAGGPDSASQATVDLPLPYLAASLVTPATAASAVAASARTSLPGPAHDAPSTTPAGFSPAAPTPPQNAPLAQGANSLHPSAFFPQAEAIPATASAPAADRTTPSAALAARPATEDDGTSSAYAAQTSLPANAPPDALRSEPSALAPPVVLPPFFTPAQPPTGADVPRLPVTAPSAPLKSGAPAPSASPAAGPQKDAATPEFTPVVAIQAESFATFQRPSSPATSITRAASENFSAPYDVAAPHTAVTGTPDNSHGSRDTNPQPNAQISTDATISAPPGAAKNAAGIGTNTSANVTSPAGTVANASNSANALAVNTVAASAGAPGPALASVAASAVPLTAGTPSPASAATPSGSSSDLSSPATATAPGLPASADAATHSAFVSSAQLTQAGAHSEMRIALQSDNLGTIELHARVSGDSVGAAITVDKRDAHIVLATELPALQQALSDKQLRVEQITVLHAPLQPTAGDAGGGQFGGTGQGQTGGRGANNSSASGFAAAQMSSLPFAAGFSVDAGDIFDAQGRLSVHA